MYKFDPWMAVKVLSAFLAGMALQYYFIQRFGPWRMQEVMKKVTPTVLVILLLLGVLKAVLFRYGVVIPW